MRRRAALALVWIVAPLGLVTNCSDDDAPPENPINLPFRDGDVVDGEASLPAQDVVVPPKPVGECDLGKPFGAPVLMPGLDANAFLATPRLSQDELTIYFTGREEDGGRSELAKAERSTRTAPFGAVVFMTAQSSLENDNDPSVALDHLSLWFHSNRTGNAELWFSTRAKVTDPWGAPALVPNVNALTAEAHAYYRAGNGGELWFVSQRGTEPTYDVYIAKRQGVGFAEPVLVPELSSTAEDWQPAPSEDGLRVLFASNRDGGAGGFDLWTAERTNVTAAFGVPKPIAEINSDAQDFAGWMSADGCRVYFSSSRDTVDGRHRLWFAERPK